MWIGQTARLSVLQISPRRSAKVLGLTSWDCKMASCVNYTTTKRLSMHYSTSGCMHAPDLAHARQCMLVVLVFLVQSCNFFFTAFICAGSTIEVTDGSKYSEAQCSAKIARRARRALLSAATSAIHFCTRSPVALVIHCSAQTRSMLPSVPKMSKISLQNWDVIVWAVSLTRSSRCVLCSCFCQQGKNCKKKNRQLENRSRLNLHDPRVHTILLRYMQIKTV